MREVWVWSRGMKRRGRPLRAPPPLRTSGRRFIARGPWRTFFFIVWLLFLETLRLDPQRYAERWRGPADRAPGSPWSRQDGQDECRARVDGARTIRDSGA